MGEIILLIVLCVLLIAMFAMSYAKRKKYNESLSSMREELKNGDKVMTDSGIVGEVVDSYSEEEYKYFVIKSGRGNNISYFSVHANAIYYVFGKEDKTESNKTAKTEAKTDAKIEVEEEQKNNDVESLVTEQMSKQANKTKTTKKKTQSTNKKSKN